MWRNLLQESEKDQRYSWILRKKKVKWHMLQMKLKHRLCARLRKELREVEYGVKVHYCEPEQGSFLGADEDKDVDERSDESLMNYWTSSDQHEGLMVEASNGAREPYILKYDNLYMVAGFADDGQSFEVVIKMEEGEGGHNSIFVLRRDKTTLSHKGNQREVHTQLIVEESLQGPVSATNRRKLVCGDSHAHDQGDEEKHSDEVLINLDEEMKLLEEMSEIEKFLIEHVFTDMEVDGVCNEASHNGESRSTR
jgi:hypothetical protein